jgi:DNA (cytosine-5)-methyltransferase 1
VTDALERLGYRWAYRVVDSRGFGLPQRRQRVVILGSLGDTEPADVLFGQQVTPDIDDSIGEIRDGDHYGFYWTEGKRAVGWAHQAVPTIKGGSGLGIPSPPAVFDVATQLTGTPSISDGERLQGFEAGWTNIVHEGKPLKVGKRWSLVGNAVSVPLADWIGKELATGPTRPSPSPIGTLDRRRPMPWALAGGTDHALQYEVSAHVSHSRHIPIGSFLTDPVKPLSQRAIHGFLRRVDCGVMKLPPAFLNALEEQLVTAPGTSADPRRRSAAL